jgi:transcriptional regulator with XRE-family HTH domain
MAETLAVKLKRLRTERSVSISGLSRKTGISRAYLSQLENGIQTNPSKDKVAALATFYRVSSNEFVYEDAPSMGGVTYEEWDEVSRRLTSEQRDEIYPILRRYATSNRTTP